VRKSVFVLCVLGFLFLVVGSGLAVPSVRTGFLTISTSGTIGYPDGSSQQVGNGQNDGTSLDLLAYAVILASFGFFIVAFLWNRRSV